MTSLATSFTRITAWWAERAPRERLMFVLMSLVVGIALLWSLWGWSRSEHLRLAKDLPQAQAKLAAMRDEAAEIQRLQRQPPQAAIEPGKLAEALEAGAKARGLQIKVNANADGPRINGHANFDTLMDWLAQIQRDHGARVTRLTVTRAGSDVQFDGELTPARPN